MVMLTTEDKLANTTVALDRDSSTGASAKTSAKRIGGERLFAFMVLLVTIAGVILTLAISYLVSPAEFARQVATSNTILKSEITTTDSEAVRDGMPIAWWLARGYMERQETPSIVVFGSSQLGGMKAADAMEAGVDLDYCLDFRGYALEKALQEQGAEKETAFIASLPGGICSDYCVALRALASSEQGKAPSLVILAVSPRDFLSNGRSELSDSKLFRFFTPFSKLSPQMLELAYPGWEERLSYILEARGFPGSKLLTPTQKKFFKGIRPGQFVFHPIDLQTYKDVDAPYPRKQTDELMVGTWFDHQLSFLEDSILELKKQGTKVMLVDMPLRERNRRQLDMSVWRQYHTKLESLSERTESLCLELSHDDEFGTEDFLDTVHLSARGGQKLAGKIVSFLQNQNKLQQK